MEKVLFVCRGNVARSQMAEGFFNYYSNGSEAISAGTSGQDYALQKVGDFSHIANCMIERGVDISNQRPKQITEEMVGNAQIIISMSQENLPAYVDRKNVDYWSVPDPASTSYAFHCNVRDKIEGLVKELLIRLD